MKNFRGKTEDAKSPFLNLAFWKGQIEGHGAPVKGRVMREFQVDGRRAWVLLLSKPLNVPPVGLVSVVALGASAGLLMAMDAAGIGNFEPGDRVLIEATGLEDSKKGSPMVRFGLSVERDEDLPEGPITDDDIPF